MNGIMRKNIRRVIALLIVFVMIVPLLPLDGIKIIRDLYTVAKAEDVAVTSGNCGANGDNVTWEYSDGVLTISGSGKMENYSSSNAPWYSLKDEIRSVVINSGVTSIGSYAFSDCISLTEIIIPAGVTGIGSYAFSDCISLTEIIIPAGVTSIGAYAFEGCSSLTGISIPEGVTSIGGGAFRGCSSLTEILVDINDVKYASEEGVLFNKTKTQLICCPGGKKGNYVIPESVTSIGDYAFGGCSSLTGINIPEGVTSIGNSAFEGCSSLTGINIPNGVTSIGWDAFYGCSSLTEINIPEGVTGIGDYAFYGCSSLKEINIPEGVTGIGERAFYGCSSLTGKINIPNGVTEIKSYTFSGCGNLVEIVIPDEVTSIGSSAFSGCSSLTKLGIPKEVTSIGSSAFYGCSSLMGEVNIPQGMTEIGSSVFSGCSSLETLSIPKSVTKIGNYAFYNCSGLTAVYYNALESDWKKISIGSNNECLTNAELRNQAHILTIDYFDLEGNKLFDSEKRSVYYMDAYEIVSPEKPGYTADSETVSGDMPYDNVTITVTYYEKGTLAFGTCGENITWRLYDDGELVLTGFGEMYDYTGKNAPWYEHAPKVSSISIDSRITKVGSYAFEDCANVTYADLGYGLESIGTGAFSGCSSLKDIVLPDTLKNIGAEAFKGCALITGVTFGSVVNSIGDNAFADCNALKSVRFYGDAPKNVGTNVFGSVTGKYIYYYSTNGRWLDEISDGKWHGYMAVPYNAIENQPFDGTNIYIIKATDSDNKPLEGAVVVLGGVSQTTNRDGMAYFAKPESAVGLSVSKFGYITYTDAGYKASQSQIMDIIELSDRPSEVQGISCSGKSIATSVVTLNCNSAGTVDITVSGDSDYTIIKYELVQGNRVISTINTSDTTCRFSVKANRFEEGNNVFVKMYTSDGKVTSAALNIDVINLADISGLQILSQLKSISMSLNLGSMGRFNIPINFDNDIPLITTRVDGRTIQVGINMDINELMGGHEDDSPDSVAIYMQNNVEKEINASLKKRKDWNASGFKTEACGYIEIEYLGNGQYYVKTNYVKVAVSANLEFNANASFYGLVGVYFKAGLTGKTTLELKISRVEPESGFKLDDLSLSMEDRLRIEGGVHILFRFGTAGIYGQAAMGFRVKLLPETELQQVYVKGEVGVTWSLLWGWIRGDHKFWSGTIYQWQKTSPYSLRASCTAALYDAARDPESYSLNDRSYLNDRTEWLSGRSLYLLRDDGGYYDLQSNIYYNVAPKVVTCGDTTMMVWLDDNAERSTDNYQTLYYSIYDADANTWSEPMQLDDNDTFDCEFDVYTDGKKIYVIYTEQKDVLSGIGDLDIEDENAVANLMEGVEVSFAVYENGAFTKPVRITDNSVCEVLPTLSSVNGVITAAWNVTDMLTPMTEGTKDSVYFSKYIDGAWTYPAPVALNTNAVSSVAVGVLSGKETYAYVVDADGNTETMEDSTLVIVDGDGNPVRLDSGSIGDVTFDRIDGKDAVIWTSDGKIRYAFTADGEIYDALPDGYTSYRGYKIITCADGRTMLTFTAEDASGGEEGTDVYGIYIGAEGACGNVVRLTETDGYIDSYDITVRDGRMIAVFTNSAASFENDKVDTVTDLRYALLELGADIRINSVSYDISDIAAGKNVTFNVEIENAGWQDIRGLSVTLYDHDMKPVYRAFEQTSVASGENVLQEIKITLPATLRKDSYYIEILPSCDGTSQDDTCDRNEDDNISELTFAYSDVSVVAEQKIIGGRNYLLLLVRNSGNMPTDAMLSVYSAGDDERLLDKLRIENIGVGEERQFLVELKGLLSDDERLVRYAVEADGYDPYTVNDDGAIYLLRIGSDEYVQSGYDTVENPELSDYSFDYDKYTDTDITVEMTVGGDKFTGIEGLDDGCYTVSDGKVIISGSYLKTLGTGKHTLYFMYDYGLQTPVKRTVTVTVSDTAPIVLTGDIAIKGNPYVGMTVYADTGEISDANAKYTYRWELDGVVVGTENKYTIPADARGKTLKLTVEGCEGYTGTLTAEADVDLTRQGVPNIPVIQKLTDKTVTLVADRGMEYSLDGTNWQTGNIFDNLTPMTEYTIYARYAATDTAYAGEIVSVPVTTQVQNFTLKGKVTSFGDADGAVTVRLLKAGKVETSVTVTNGEYVFEGIDSGTYTLEVSKANHATRRYEVSGNDAEVVLDAKIHLIGDVTGDGAVKIGDYAKVLAYVRGTAELNEYELECADVTGDGAVKIGDYAKILAHVCGTDLMW